MYLILLERLRCDPLPIIEFVMGAAMVPAWRLSIGSGISKSDARRSWDLGPDAGIGHR
jgi:hypothetical protein